MKVKACIRLVIIGITFSLNGNAAAESSDSHDFLFTSMLLGMFTSGPTTIMTFDITESTKKLRIGLFVKDDAAAFVATDGAVRGPFLESALEVLREDKSLSCYSDYQLTHALLAG